MGVDRADADPIASDAGQLIAAAPVPTPVKHSEKPSAPVRAGLAELREAARRRRAA